MAKKRVKHVDLQRSFWDEALQRHDDPRLTLPPAAPRELSPLGIAMTAVMNMRPLVVHREPTAEKEGR